MFIVSVWRMGDWVGVSCALSLKWTNHGVEGGEVAEEGGEES